MDEEQRAVKLGAYRVQVRVGAKEHTRFEVSARLGIPIVGHDMESAVVWNSQSAYMEKQSNATYV